MNRLRLVYGKSKDAIYISQEETVKILNDTFTKAQIPVVKSNSTNMVDIIFAHPLIDGYKSTGEVVEVNLTEEIEIDEEERYYYLPSRYQFHDSELIEEYIDKIENRNIQEKFEEAFYGKGKYRRFKEILRKYRIENDYYNFREEYLKNMAIEWCQKNNIEYEE